MLDNELNFYKQTVFLYATSYFEFKRRQSTSGIEKMKQAIQVLDILGEDKLKMHYTSHFDKLITNKRNNYLLFNLPPFLDRSLRL